jgi:diamine N-acetyltransferase
MIREANKKDALNLAALSIQVWLDTYAVTGIRTEISKFVLSTFSQDYFSSIIDNKNYKILVALEGGLLVGYVMANFEAIWQDSSNGYEIDKLYVQGHFQGKGIGKRLLAEMSKQCGGTFWLSTWKDNINAIAFYKRIGFKDIGSKLFEFEGEAHENRVLVVKQMC